MPIFEFFCPNCKTKFEEIVDNDIKQFCCPVCQTKSNKIVSLTNFVLRGNCWSKDNYAKTPKK